MQNNSKSEKATDDLFQFQQIVNLITKIAGNQKDLQVDVKNLKVNLGTTQIAVESQVNIGLSEGTEVREARIGVRGTRSQPQPPKQTAQPLSARANVVVSAGNKELINIDAASKNIDIDIENKDFLKGLIKIGRSFTKNQQNKTSKDKGKKQPGTLSTARTVAENLKRRGITISLSYKGGRVATLGADAHSTLLQIITKTRAIALNSPLRAIRMLI